MKNVARVVLVLVSLGTTMLRAADMPMAPTAERFYGKITSIDLTQKNVVVHNKKQKMDARFQWNEQTAITSQKKSIAPTELKVGQSLIVSYVTENDINQAKKINVRQPFKKNSP